jgi:hypothetical protein
MSRKLVFSILNISISILLSSFVLIIAIPYVSSQEDVDNSPAKQQFEQEFNQLSPEHKKMILPMLQEAAQKAITEASPEEQEILIQQMKQVYPPQIFEKIVPAEVK